jgi:dihydrofolate reductase
MTISIIAAIGKNRELGDHGKIPWHLPADFANFKKVTTGHPVIMGRKTYESIGRPLPGRRNIIVTRQADYRAEGSDVVGSLDAAFKLAGEAKSAGSDEVFVIGGAEIYKEALPFASKLYLTKIDHEFSADTFFPEVAMSSWKKIEDVAGVQDEKNVYPYRFVVYEKLL